jgi:hypothetical protein
MLPNPKISAGTPKHRLRLAKRLLLALGTLVCGIYLVELCCVWYRYHVAVRLVNSVRELRVGVTSTDEVRQLSERFGGRFYPSEPTELLLPQASPSYAVMISSPYISFRDHFFPFLGPGIRFWAVSANLGVEGGHLSEIRLEVHVQRADQVGLSSNVSVTNKISRDPDATYYVSEAHVTGPPTEALQVAITPDASSEERRKAFDFAVGCLTSLRQCHHTCELSPSAWPDLGDHRMYYEDGREKVVEAECENSLANKK